jgi:flagellar motility protein MotE (MotC chaperone)
VKIIIFVVLVYNSLWAIQTSDKLFECTEIFQERKSELLVELERIDEQKQALDSLKGATEVLLRDKEAKLSIKEEEVDKKLLEVEEKSKNIKKMLEKNTQMLKELQTTKMSKIAQTFAKMKAGASAQILADMNLDDAVLILQSLKPKIVGQILSKMDAKKASELTILLVK